MSQKARWVPLVHWPSLHFSGQKEPIFKGRDGLKGYPGKLSGNGWKAAGAGRELLMGQEMRKCRGTNMRNDMEK